MTLNREDLWKLRKEIVLNSVMFGDYKNSFNIDIRWCCAYFDGYADYLQELMSDDGIADDAYLDNLDKYDNADNLWAWENCHDEDALPLEEEYFLEMVDTTIDTVCRSITESEGWSAKSDGERYSIILDTLNNLYSNFERDFPTEVRIQQERCEDESGEMWYDDHRMDYLETYAN